MLCAGLLAIAAGTIADFLVHPVSLEKNVYIIDTSAVASSTDSTKPKGPILEPVMALLASADAAIGQKIFKKCAACHTTDNGGKSKVGPNLFGVVNSKKGSKDGFSYSAALLGFEGAPNWDYGSLNAFLAKPKAYMPGT